MANQHNQTLVTLGRELFRFESEDHWIEDGRVFYETAGLPSRRTVAIDAKGRICISGAEFARATREGAYPIVVSAGVNPKG